MCNRAPRIDGPHQVGTHTRWKQLAESSRHGVSAPHTLARPTGTKETSHGISSSLPYCALSLCLPPAIAQTPGSYVPFGTGCGSGTTPPSLSAPKLPVIGREFTIAVTNVQPNNVGILVFGRPNTVWRRVNLPMPLNGFGAPGCNLYVSIDANLWINTGKGTAYLQTVLPKDLGLIGASFYNQFISPDPRANAAGTAFSNGAKATIGSCLCLPEENITESFATDAMLDKNNSGGFWVGGEAIAAQVGGTGRHGMFDYKLGVRVGSVYTWNTDNMTIPGTHTESGRTEFVRNGVFEFGSMNVPTGVTVRFVGTNRDVVKVRGVAQIDGTIEVNGTDAAYFAAAPTPGNPARFGQPGSTGGAGGGPGGKGGDSCPNTGANTKYDGQNGSDVRLKAGHAYATQSRGTGGKGSPHWPRNGKNTIYCALTGLFAAGVAAGGGVFALRVGRHLGVGASGIIGSRGGKGYLIDGGKRSGEPNDNLFNVPAPGGGGSGGTVLLQVEFSTNLLGLIDCSGGKGGILDNSPTNQSGLLTKAAGGDGGPGYLRLEVSIVPRPSQLGRTMPKADASNVGRLVDYDIKVTSQSKIYNTGLSFSPYFLRYEVEAKRGRSTFLYSDDPTLTHPDFVGPASAGKPIQFRIQGRKLDQKTNKTLWTGPWRDNVRTGMTNSLGSDDANSWRFQLIYDRAATPAIAVTKVRIWYQR